MSLPSNNPLSKRHEFICTYGGVFGILLSIACMIQHMIVTTSSWIAQAMTPYYLLAAVAFFLLSLQKMIAPILIIISTVLSLAVQWVWMKDLSFSLLVLMLVLYHATMIVMIYVEQVPQTLKLRKQQRKAEEEMWAGKL